jgi:hypothetical protein
LYTVKLKSVWHKCQLHMLAGHIYCWLCCNLANTSSFSVEWLKAGMWVCQTTYRPNSSPSDNKCSLKNLIRYHHEKWHVGLIEMCFHESEWDWLQTVWRKMLMTMCATVSASADCIPQKHTQKWSAELGVPWSAMQDHMKKDLNSHHALLDVFMNISTHLKVLFPVHSAHDRNFVFWAKENLHMTADLEHNPITCEHIGWHDCSSFDSPAFCWQIC